MGLTGVLKVIGFCTVIGIIGLVATVLLVNPFDGWVPGFIMFYASLFLTCMGIASGLGILIRFRFRSQTSRSGAALRSVRQGALASVLAVTLLILLGAQRLNAINTAALVLLVVVTEYFLGTLKKQETV